MVWTLGGGQTEWPVRVRADVVDEFYLAVGGHRIRVQRRNKGKRRPLILINGIGAALEMWQPFVDEVDDRDIISLDLPGCGLSPALLLPIACRESPRWSPRSWMRWACTARMSAANHSAAWLPWSWCTGFPLG
jgi:pimeloyl-ACP methyl ester carboxylesterase